MSDFTNEPLGLINLVRLPEPSWQTRLLWLADEWTPFVVRTALFAALAYAILACSHPTAPQSDCPRPPGDTATVIYNGERIYLRACPGLP